MKKITKKESKNYVNQINNNLSLEKNKHNLPCRKGKELQQRQIETAINNLLTAIEKGDVSSSIMERLRNLESRQQTLEEQIAIENCKKSFELTESEIRKYYSKAIQMNDKMLIEYLIKKVILYDDKIQIILNRPINHISPDPNRTGFFISNKKIKHYLVKYGYTKSRKIIDTKVELLIS